MKKAFLFICMGFNDSFLYREKERVFESVRILLLQTSNCIYAQQKRKMSRISLGRRRKNYHLVISSLTAPYDWFVPGTGVVAFSLVNFGICMNIQKMIFGKKRRSFKLNCWSL